jgi:hypothetical protein
VLTPEAWATPTLGVADPLLRRARNHPPPATNGRPSPGPAPGRFPATHREWSLPRPEDDLRRHDAADVPALGDKAKRAQHHEEQPIVLTDDELGEIGLRALAI